MFRSTMHRYRLLQSAQHFGKVLTQRRLDSAGQAVSPMDNGNLRDQILRLEAEIDELTEVMESCRKVILVSKIAIAAGGIWLLALCLGQLDLMQSL
jgi:hypothetical protein